ncbi:MAG: acyl-CoA transferase [Pararhodobacter sp.]|nr:acyl-CoA transferase [Pararhodobacter sp.]
MPTPRESILTALHSRISALSATALRGEVLPGRVPAAGLLILRGGEPGEPKVTLSPLRYHYQHRAEVEAVVQGADHTLSGHCDWMEAQAPRPVDLPVEGAASVKAAVIAVVLHHTNADPLG